MCHVSILIGRNDGSNVEVAERWQTMAEEEGRELSLLVTRRELKRLSELACASISTRASIGVKKIALP